MDRMACVDLPALPLQILLRNHPDWCHQPVAVVDRDKPLGVIQWVNEPARACRILPGMRYAAGLSLSRELHAGVVPERQIAEEENTLVERLGLFSPHIESSSREPGIFWLDASGLLPLYPSFEKWAAQVQEELLRIGFQSVVVVGYSRFGSYAATKASARNIVFPSPDHENAYLRAVPVDRLEWSPKMRDSLLKLGISTLGAFVDLPPGGIRRRFGAEAQELYCMAKGARQVPLSPRLLMEPIERRVLFDHVEKSRERLLAVLQPLLDSILFELARRQEALTLLRLSMAFDDGSKRWERLSPAAPTLDPEQLFRLVRLRVESLSFASGVVEFRIEGAGVAASQRQLDLFCETPHRQLASVERAFAAIRAELGNYSVVFARLHEGHLPEARFGWESLERIVRPEPRLVTLRPLVRRILLRPVLLPSPSRHQPDGWFVSALADGPVEERIGPHIVSGGWWTREVSRAYHYVRTKSGRWLWIYRDQKRRRWFLHGEV